MKRQIMRVEVSIEEDLRSPYDKSDGFIHAVLSGSGGAVWNEDDARKLVRSAHGSPNWERRNTGTPTPYCIARPTGQVTEGNSNRWSLTIVIPYTG